MHIYPETAIDFYKSGHIFQYPRGTNLVYSNLTCRSDKLAQVLPDFDHRVVFFGAQGVCRWLFEDVWHFGFFARSKEHVLDRYKRRMDKSLGVGAVPVDHISALHDYGRLPLRIKALPEGSRVSMRVPVMTWYNTHPDFFWLTNYIETQLSAEMWKSIYCATIAYEYKRLLKGYAERTGSPLDFVPWQAHDFSARGMAGIYDSAQSGVGHLLSFLGTDTVGAIDYAERYYDAADEFIGGSVPATEHSVMSMGGKVNELDTFRRLVQDVYPSGVVSIVSDTWDFWKVINEYAATLKDVILSRQPNELGLAKVVFRPDSGDPVKIIAGDPDAPAGSAPNKGAVECLWDIFGGTTTSTSHRLLNERVGVIYGDSITLDRASRILSALHEKGFASGNIVFGVGSYTYQHCTRDSFGCAVKATYGEVNGEGRALFKAPVTDSGIKNSATGLLRVERDPVHGFVLHENQTWDQEGQGALQDLFVDGQVVRHETLGDSRKRLAESA